MYPFHVCVIVLLPFSNNASHQIKVIDESVVAVIDGCYSKQYQEHFCYKQKSPCSKFCALINFHSLESESSERVSLSHQASLLGSHLIDIPPLMPEV